MALNFNRIMALFLLFVFVLTVRVEALSIFDGSEGHFEKVECPYNFNPFYQAKLDNGNILFNNESGSKKDTLIFNPKTNKFAQTNDEKIRFRTSPPLLYLGGTKFYLSDGNICEPSEMFRSEVLNLIGGDFLKEAERRIYSDEDFINKYPTIDSRKKAIEEERLRIVYSYNILPEEEKEKIYLPKMKENPELYKKYLEYKKIFAQGAFGLIYDMDTKESERFKIPNELYYCKILLLDNEKLLILKSSQTGVIFPAFNERIRRELSKPGEIRITFYTLDLNTKNVETIKIDKNIEKELDHIRSAIKTKDGKIVFIKQGKIIFLNPKTMEFNIYPFEKYNSEYVNVLELNDGRIALFSKQTRSGSAKVIIFDPKTSKCATYESKIERKNDYNVALLKNGKVLILGGCKPDVFIGYLPVVTANIPFKKAEIFDPDTGEFKQISDMIYLRRNMGSVTLDDGRVLIYGYGEGKYIKNVRCEMFIPKEYKAKRR